MANDDYDLFLQLNVIQNNILFNELFIEPRRYMVQEDPFDGKFNVKLLYLTIPII